MGPGCASDLFPGSAQLQSRHGLPQHASKGSFSAPHPSGLLLFPFPLPCLCFFQQLKAEKQNRVRSTLRGRKTCPKPKIISRAVRKNIGVSERITQPCPSPHTIEGQLDVACVQRSSPLVKAYDVGEVLKCCVHLHTEAPVLWAQQCVKARGTTGRWAKGIRLQGVQAWPLPSNRSHKTCDTP